MPKYAGTAERRCRVRRPPCRFLYSESVGRCGECGFEHDLRREPTAGSTVVRPDGPNERAERDGYVDQPSDDVARPLIAAAKLCTNVLSHLAPQDWERTVMYNYPNPAERSLRWVAVHTAHEVRHHLLDIRCPVGETV